jgi:hypothetical protein
MIVQATRISRKGGIQYLARHLLDKSDENDRIEVLAGDRAALQDAQMLAEVKGCRYSIRCWFPRGIEPVFPPRSEPPLSMVF